jgi:hypothetical protein
VDGPRVGWARGRVGVPELGLENLTSWIIEAARVGVGSRVMTAQRSVGRTRQCGHATTRNRCQRRANGEGNANSEISGQHLVHVEGLSTIDNIIDGWEGI